MLKHLAILLFFSFVFTGCDFYRQHVMLEIDKETRERMLKQEVKEAERNYIVRINDHIDFQLFTNKGEIIVDPTNELAKALENNTGANRLTAGKPKYLIQWDGYANLPLVGKVKLNNLTVAQMDSVLAEKYSIYYKDVYVLSKVENRRVVILNLGLGGTLGGAGGVGGGGAAGMNAGNRARVISLEHENMNIFEVLANAGGIGMFAHAEKIRIIRGDLRDPQVIVVNLRTVSTARKSDLRVFPNDIIYVEPGRRLVLDVIRDSSGIISLFVSFTTVLVLLTRRF